MKYLFVVFLTSLLFFSCSNDTDEVLNPKPYLSQTNQVNTVLVGYSSLGDIPAIALSKMTKEEKDVWSKVGEKLYINYSFLDSAFYKNNKKQFLERYNAYYETQLKKCNEPAYLIFSKSCVSKVNAKRRIANRFEQGKNGWYYGTAAVWKNGKSSVSVLVTASYVGQSMSDWKCQVITTPKNSEFVGEPMGNMDPITGICRIRLTGKYLYEDEYVDIDTIVEVDVKHAGV